MHNNEKMIFLKNTHNEVGSGHYSYYLSSGKRFYSFKSNSLSQAPVLIFS